MSIPEPPPRPKPPAIQYVRICAAAFAALTGLGMGVAQATQPVPVPVTVFDLGFKPYQAYGRATAGGAVIVFEETMPAPLTHTYPTAVAPPELGAPIGTAAGAATQARPPVPHQPVVTSQAPTKRQVEKMAQSTGDPAAGKRHVEGIYALNTDYLLSYPRTAYRILSAPARFDRSDWITAALVMGAGGALFLLDEPLINFWQDHINSGGTRDAADILAEFGDSKNVLIGSVAAYAMAEALDSTGLANARREKSAALLTLQSFLLTQGIVTGLKYVAGRTRPDNTDEADDFEGPGKGDFNASFPSGHAGTAFSTASVLAETYGHENPWVPYLAYGLATGTALARVDDNRHWFSDVFIGAVIGYFVGKTVTRYSPFLESNNITLLPFKRGLGLAYRF